VLLLQHVLLVACLQQARAEVEIGHVEDVEPGAFSL
jgi:hypothetical protein